MEKKKILYNSIGLDPVAGWKSNKFFPKEIYDKYEFVLTKKNPDFVFYSCFIPTLGLLTKYNDSVKIFFSGENVSPDFIFFDYWIGFDDIKFGNRFFRYPFCFWESEYIDDVSSDTSKNKKEYFCDFIYSHDDINNRRETIFNKLSEYKQVSSFGSLLNNTGIRVNKNNKQDIQSKCKFSLIIESVDTDGFITEKLVHAMKAGSIPIYFGTSKVTEYFNPKRFINANDFASLKEVIEEVKRIDSDDKLYQKMVKEDIYVKGFDPVKLKEEYIKYLDSILSKGRVIVRDRQFNNARYLKAFKRYSRTSLPIYPMKKTVKKMLGR